MFEHNKNTLMRYDVHTFHMVVVICYPYDSTDLNATYSVEVYYNNAPIPFEIIIGAHSIYYDLVVT